LGDLARNGRERPPVPIKKEIPSIDSTAVRTDRERGGESAGEKSGGSPHRDQDRPRFTLSELVKRGKKKRPVLVKCHKREEEHAVGAGGLSQTGRKKKPFTGLKTELDNGKKAGFHISIRPTGAHTSEGRWWFLAVSYPQGRICKGGGRRQLAGRRGPQREDLPV